MRNRLKVESTVANARAVLSLRDSGETLDGLLWGFVGGEPRRNRWRKLADLPAQTDESRAMSRELKRRGFRFVGPTVCYSLMQAVGLVNDHVVSCFRLRGGRVSPDAALEELAERARSQGRIGLDTEFVSEGRYRALLCLVQLVVEGDDGPEIVVVDALDGEGPGPVGAVLADPAVEVVVHAGRQDIPLVKRVWGVQPRNLFDTQIAAAFVGASVQPSYEALLGQFLRTPVSKSATFTRWDRRPLTDEQLSYARADVEHLLPLAASLRERLEQRGRLEWAREESRPLEDVSDERDPEEVFRRLPRVADLKAQAAAVALELTRWREDIAEREDRHVRWILPDPAIVEVARRQPTKLGQLGDIRGVKGSSVRRLGPEILDVVRRGREAPPVKLDRARAEIPPDEAGALVALAEALLRGAGPRGGACLRPDRRPRRAAGGGDLGTGGPGAAAGAGALGLAPRSGGCGAARAAGGAPQVTVGERGLLRSEPNGSPNAALQPGAGAAEERSAATRSAGPARDAAGRRGSTGGAARWWRSAACTRRLRPATRAPRCPARSSARSSPARGSGRARTAGTPPGSRSWGCRGGCVAGCRSPTRSCGRRPRSTRGAAHRGRGSAGARLR